MFRYNQVFFFIGTVVFCFSSLRIEAEQSGTVVPPGYVVVPVAPQKPVEPSVFDSPKNTTPKTLRSAVSGADRYVGEEPDYNTEQRAEWLEICAPKKNDPDIKAYGVCYENEKKKSAASLRQNLEGGRRQAPLLNSADSSLSNLPSLDEKPQSPAFEERYKKD